jgi:hypothetical protein
MPIDLVKPSPTMPIKFVQPLPTTPIKLVKTLYELRCGDNLETQYMSNYLYIILIILYIGLICDFFTNYANI